MKLTVYNMNRTAKLAVSHAVRRIAQRGFEGEAARARVMSDSWQSTAREMFGQANAERMKAAGALLVVRQLSLALQSLIFRAEIAERKSRTS